MIGPGMRLAIGLTLVYAGLAHAEVALPGPPPPAAPAIGPTLSARWAVALALGGESLTPTASASTSESIGYLEGAVRFRPVLNTEIQLAIDLGGRADAKYSALFLDVRYRFNPEDTWRWSLTGGVGLASAAAPDASDLDKKGRGALRFGGGLERRFGAFAVMAELRLMLIAANHAAPDRADPTPAYYFARYGMSSYGFQLGGSYAW